MASVLVVAERVQDLHRTTPDQTVVDHCRFAVSARTVIPVDRTAQAKRRARYLAARGDTMTEDALPLAGRGRAWTAIEGRLRPTDFIVEVQR